MVILEMVSRMDDPPPDFYRLWPHLEKYVSSICYTIFRATPEEVSAADNAYLVAAVKRGDILDFSAYRPDDTTREALNSTP